MKLIFTIEERNQLPSWVPLFIGCFFLSGGAKGLLRSDILDNFEPHHTSSLHLLPVSLGSRTLRYLELGLQARRPPLTYHVILQLIDIYIFI